MNISFYCDGIFAMSSVCITSRKTVNKRQTIQIESIQIDIYFDFFFQFPNFRCLFSPTKNRLGKWLWAKFEWDQNGSGFLQFAMKRNTKEKEKEWHEKKELENEERDVVLKMRNSWKFVQKTIASVSFKCGCCVVHHICFDWQWILTLKMIYPNHHENKWFVIFS